MRWKYFLPTLLIIALIAVFNMFFLDSIIKKMIISSGEAVFGAKVEVLSVNTKIRNLSIDIKGIKAANKSSVYRNLFEIDEAKLSVKPVPLFSMKLIIDDMTIKGIKWGTLRETSGALPPKKLAKIEKQRKNEDKDGIFSKITNKLIENGKNEFSQLPAIESVKNAGKDLKDFDLNKAISIDDLQSIKAMEEMKQEFNNKFIRYNDQIKSLDADRKVKEAITLVTDMSRIKIAGINDVESLKVKLDDVNKVKGELEKSIEEIKALKIKAESDFGADKDLLNRINELKDMDIKALSEKFKIPAVSSEGFAKAIFGPVWIARVERTLYYVSLTRKYMPPRKKTAKRITVKRLHGTDVSFPKTDNPPDFLIAKIMIAGTSGGEGKTGTPLDFSGEVKDITSDQALLGRPVTFALSGAQGAKALEIAGVFDHITENAVDTFAFKYIGLTAEEMNLPQSEYLPSFKDGSGEVSGSFTIKGDDLEAYVDLTVKNFKMPEFDKNDEIKMIAVSLWKGIDSISVNAKIIGAGDKMNLSVTSNIDKLISERLKNIYGEKIVELQNKIKSEIDRMTNEKRAEVISQYNLKRDELMGHYNGKQKELSEKLNELTKMKYSKEAELRAMADNAKKQAEDTVNAQKIMAEEKALAEQRKLQAEAEAEKAKVQANAEAEKQEAEQERKRLGEEAKKKAEDEAKKKAQEQMKGFFGK